MSDSQFRNRKDAGCELASRVAARVGAGDALVLGLPRGGVPVAFEIAKRMRAQLDICMAGKIGYPGRPELALGAVTSDGALYLDAELADRAGLSLEKTQEMALRRRIGLERMDALYRQGGPAPHIEGRTVILADDGAATGASMCVALRALKGFDPRYLIAALPVASRAAVERIRRECEDLICLKVPEPFFSVGEWYEQFPTVPDEEVVRCLETAKAWHWSPIPDRKAVPDTAAGIAGRLNIRCGEALLAADLAVPAHPRGLVLFAHGSGGGRHSTRDRRIASGLNARGFATLLVDLLTDAEERDAKGGGARRLDLRLLTSRLICVARAMESDPSVMDLPIGLFGAGTGAAAALRAGARLKETVAAVATRGGRVDLAEECLPDVIAPCLFIVGGADTAVLEANREAIKSVRAEKSLEIVPGATHLFEEPGALETVEKLAAHWFSVHLAVIAGGAAR